VVRAEAGGAEAGSDTGGAEAGANADAGDDERRRVVGVRVEGRDGSERLDCDYVVNAAGPWAARVASMAGVDLPVTPQRRQVAVVDPETPVPESVPLTIDLDTGAYFRPEREGRALVGGFFGDEADSVADPDAYDTGIDLDWVAEALERAADAADYFGPDSRVVRGWAGLYAVTPNHHPILEETVPGFVTAAGFSGHGFQHAPAVGQIVAELCLDGEASLVDIEPLRSDRFEEGEGPVERNVA
jgi:sarcosine oxidase subunit beta